MTRPWKEKSSFSPYDRSVLSQPELDGILVADNQKISDFDKGTG